MNLRRHHGLSFLATLVAIAPTAVVADDWPSWGHDNARSRVSHERTGPSFELAWRARLPGDRDLLARAVTSSPAVAEGFLAFGAMNNVLRVLNASTGHELWHQQAEGAFVASPTIHRGRVFVASLDGVLHAHRLTDGLPLWSRPFGVTYGSVTVVEDDQGEGILVAAGFPHRRVYRLNPITGAVVWETSDATVERSSYSSIAVAGNLAIAGVVGGTLHALDLRSGALKWTRQLGGELYTSSPILASQTLFVLTTTDKAAALHALDPVTGHDREGWPLALAAPEATTDGIVLLTRLAVSSLAHTGEKLFVQLRLVEHIDTNGKAGADLFRQREYLMAVSTAAPSILWTLDNGTRTSAHAGDIPTLTFCPSPALFLSPQGTPILAAASSTATTLRVLNPNSGQVLWSGTLAGVSRSSPAFSNGRLYVGTDAGTLDAFHSMVNHPPTAPLVAETLQLAANAPLLRWQPANDPEAQPLSYLVRLDADGEVLHDWLLETTTKAGQTELRLPTNLRLDTAYTVSVRARDSMGAWSPWSAPASLHLEALPSVAIGNEVHGTLADALRVARPGDVINLGPGRHVLAAPMTLPPGVSVQGAGARSTVIVGSKLDGAFVVTGTGISASSPGTLSQLHITDAAVGIDLQANSALTIKNVVISNTTSVAIRVAESAKATVVNVTLAANAVAVHTIGTASIRNSIVVNNKQGFKVEREAAFTSRYNNVFGNRENLIGMPAHSSDQAKPVSFAPGDAFLVAHTQATTDKGDPNDDFSLEPAPNGGRVNLGAYGNTADAERSESPAPVATVPEGEQGEVDHGMAEPSPDPAPASGASGAPPPSTSDTERPPSSAGFCAMGGTRTSSFATWGVGFALFVAGRLVRLRQRKHLSV